MKKHVYFLIVPFFIMFFSFSSAQELTKDQINAFHNDDITSFKKLFSSADYNKCYEVKNRSYSVLSFATRFNKEKIVNYVTKNNSSSVNFVCNGMTPLMEASHYGYKNLVKKYIALGANKDLKNAEGKTAADLANERKFSDIALMLK